MPLDLKRIASGLFGGREGVDKYDQRDGLTALGYDPALADVSSETRQVELDSRTKKKNRPALLEALRAAGYPDSFADLPAAAIQPATQAYDAQQKRLREAPGREAFADHLQNIPGGRFGNRNLADFAGRDPATARQFLKPEGEVSLAQTKHNAQVDQLVAGGLTKSQAIALAGSEQGRSEIARGAGLGSDAEIPNFASYQTAILKGKSATAEKQKRFGVAVGLYNAAHPDEKPLSAETLNAFGYGQIVRDEAVRLFSEQTPGYQDAYSSLSGGDDGPVKGVYSSQSAENAIHKLNEAIQYGTVAQEYIDGYGQQGGGQQGGGLPVDPASPQGQLSEPLGLQSQEFPGDPGTEPPPAAVRSDLGQQNPQYLGDPGTGLPPDPASGSIPDQQNPQYPEDLGPEPPAPATPSATKFPEDDGSGVPRVSSSSVIQTLDDALGIGGGRVDTGQGALGGPYSDTPNAGLGVGEPPPPVFPGIGRSQDFGGPYNDTPNAGLGGEEPPPPAVRNNGGSHPRLGGGLPGADPDVPGASGFDSRSGRNTLDDAELAGYLSEEELDRLTARPGVKSVNLGKKWFAHQMRHGVGSVADAYLNLAARNVSLPQAVGNMLRGEPIQTKGSKLNTGYDSIGQEIHSLEDGGTGGYRRHKGERGGDSLADQMDSAAEIADYEEDLAGDISKSGFGGKVAGLINRVPFELLGAGTAITLSHIRAAERLANNPNLAQSSGKRKDGTLNPGGFPQHTPTGIENASIGTAQEAAIFASAPLGKGSNAVARGLKHIPGLKKGVGALAADAASIAPTGALPGSVIAGSETHARGGTPEEVRQAIKLGATIGGGLAVGAGAGAKAVGKVISAIPPPAVKKPRVEPTVGGRQGGDTPPPGEPPPATTKEGPPPATTEPPPAATSKPKKPPPPKTKEGPPPATAKEPPPAAKTKPKKPPKVEEPPKEDEGGVQSDFKPVEEGETKKHGNAIRNMFKKVRKTGEKKDVDTKQIVQYVNETEALGQTKAQAALAKAGGDRAKAEADLAEQGIGGEERLAEIESIQRQNDANARELANEHKRKGTTPERKAEIAKELRAAQEANVFASAEARQIKAARKALDDGVPASKEAPNQGGLFGKEPPPAAVSKTKTKTATKKGPPPTTQGKEPPPAAVSKTKTKTKTKKAPPPATKEPPPPATKTKTKTKKAPPPATKEPPPPATKTKTKTKKAPPPETKEPPPPVAKTKTKVKTKAKKPPKEEAKKKSSAKKKPVATTKGHSDIRDDGVGPINLPDGDEDVIKLKDAIKAFLKGEDVHFPTYQSNVRDALKIATKKIAEEVYKLAGGDAKIYKKLLLERGLPIASRKKINRLESLSLRHKYHWTQDSDARYLNRPRNILASLELDQIHILQKEFARMHRRDTVVGVVSKVRVPRLTSAVAATRLSAATKVSALKKLRGNIGGQLREHNKGPTFWRIYRHRGSAIDKMGKTERRFLFRLERQLLEAYENYWWRTINQKIRDLEGGEKLNHAEAGIKEDIDEILNNVATKDSLGASVEAVLPPQIVAMRTAKTFGERVRLLNEFFDERVKALEADDAIYDKKTAESAEGNRIRKKLIGDEADDLDLESREAVRELEEEHRKTETSPNDHSIEEKTKALDLLFRSMGLAKTGVSMRNVPHDPQWGGYWEEQKARITMVLSASRSLENLRGTLRHEALHAFASLFTDAEKRAFDPFMAILMKKHRVEKRWGDTYRARDMSDAEVHAALREEAIAEEFRVWSRHQDDIEAGRTPIELTVNDDGVLNAWQRVHKVLTKLRDKMVKAGYDDYEQVFKDMRSGKFGERQRDMARRDVVGRRFSDGGDDGGGGKKPPKKPKRPPKNPPEKMTRSDREHIAGKAWKVVRDVNNLLLRTGDGVAVVFKPSDDVAFKKTKKAYRYQKGVLTLRADVKTDNLARYTIQGLGLKLRGQDFPEWRKAYPSKQQGKFVRDWEDFMFDPTKLLKENPEAFKLFINSLQGKGRKRLRRKLQLMSGQVRRAQFSTGGKHADNTPLNWTAARSAAMDRTNWTKMIDMKAAGAKFGLTAVFKNDAPFSSTLYGALNRITTTYGQMRDTGFSKFSLVNDRTGEYSFDKIPGSLGLTQALKPVYSKASERRWAAYAQARSSEERLKMGLESHLDELNIEDRFAMVRNDKERKLFDKVYDDFRRVMEEFLDFQESTGLLSAKQRKEFRFEYHFPIVRENAGIRGKFKQAQGGRGNLEEPLFALTEHLHSLSKAAIHNSFKRVLAAQASNRPDIMTRIDKTRVEQIRAGKDQGDAMREGNAFRSEDSSEINRLQGDEPYSENARDSALAERETNGRVMTVYEEGKPIYYEIHNDMILDVMNHMGPPVRHPVMALANKGRAFIQATITSTPNFVIDNIIRDAFMTSALATGTKVNPITTLVKGTGLAFSPTKKARNFRQKLGYYGNLGGGPITADRNTLINPAHLPARMSFSRFAAQMRDRPIVGTALVPPQMLKLLAIGWTNQITRRGETIMRYGNFSQRIKEGQSFHKALEGGTEDSTDFSTRPASQVVQSFNDVLPFFGAIVKGHMRVARELGKSPGKVGVGYSAQAVVRAGVHVSTIAIAGAGIDWLQRDNPFKQNESFQDRQNFITVWVKHPSKFGTPEPKTMGDAIDQNYYLGRVKVPVFHEVGQASKILESTVQFIAGGDVELGEVIRYNLAQTVLSYGSPDSFLLKELWSGKNFQGRNIVPTNEKHPGTGEPLPPITHSGNYQLTEDMWRKMAERGIIEEGVPHLKTMEHLLLAIVNGTGRGALQLADNGYMHWTGKGKGAKWNRYSLWSPGMDVFTDQRDRLDELVKSSVSAQRTINILRKRGSDGSKLSKKVIESFGNKYNIAYDVAAKIADDVKETHSINKEMQDYEYTPEFARGLLLQDRYAAVGLSPVDRAEREAWVEGLNEKDLRKAHQKLLGWFDDTARTRIAKIEEQKGILLKLAEQEGFTQKKYETFLKEKGGTLGVEDYDELISDLESGTR